MDPFKLTFCIGVLMVAAFRLLVSDVFNSVVVPGIEPKFVSLKEVV